MDTLNHSTSRDIVLMSTADWDHPFWTNKQHTAQTLVQLGYRVFYIDTLGSRKLRLGKITELKRIWKRIKKIFTKPKEVKPNLWVWSPCVLPISNIALIRWLNKILFSRLLKYWLQRLQFSTRPLFWTYNPLTLLYINPNQYSQFIYHCVDNIAEQPNAHTSLIQKWETELFKRADIIFVTARALEQHARQFNNEVYYFPNVVDFNHFNQACQNILTPADLQLIPEPRAGFIGAISAYKIDLELLVAVAKINPTISFVLIGLVGEGDPDTNVNQLKQLTNVYLLGPKKYNDLPNYLKGLDVCLIPANINEYTKAMFPMKFFEYLAAAKPIVATDIDAIRDYSSLYYVAQDANEFSQQIKNALTTNNQQRIAERVLAAKENTYLTRTKRMLACINRKPL